jgi:choice-of-anchor A domain-containing protein
MLSTPARGACAAILLASVALAPAANATTPVGDPVAGLQAMRELNLIVLGDMKGGANVEGKTFVGGDLTNGTQFGVGRATQGAAASTRPTLTVVGDVEGNGINLQNGSNGGNGLVGTPVAVVVGGDLTGSGLNLNASNAIVQVGGNLKNVNGSAGSTIQAGGEKQGSYNANGATAKFKLGEAFAKPLKAGLSAEQAQLEADLEALSLELAGLADTKGNSTSAFGSRLTFVAVDDGTGRSVFNLSEKIFDFGELAMTLSDPKLTVIVNITGDGRYSWNSNAVLGLNSDLNGSIIWNFADATSLQVKRMTHGSILAPFAKLTNSADMEGSIVAKSFEQRGQVHLGTYAGPLTFTPAQSLGIADAVPEPASWALLIAGFGVVGGAMRRRRAAGPQGVLS